MTPRTRPVSWIRAALKEFEAFPEGARSICMAALTIAAEEIWVVHAFQKKSTYGIKTPKRKIDPIRDRLKRLKEMLR